MYNIFCEQKCVTANVKINWIKWYRHPCLQTYNLKQNDRQCHNYKSASIYFTDPTVSSSLLNTILIIICDYGCHLHIKWWDVSNDFAQTHQVHNKKKTISTQPCCTATGKAKGFDAMFCTIMSSIVVVCCSDSQIEYDPWWEEPSMPSQVLRMRKKGNILNAAESSRKNIKEGKVKSMAVY